MTYLLNCTSENLSYRFTTVGPPWSSVKNDNICCELLCNTKTKTSRINAQFCETKQKPVRRLFYLQKLWCSFYKWWKCAWHHCLHKKCAQVHHNFWMKGCSTRLDHYVTKHWLFMLLCYAAARASFSVTNMNIFLKSKKRKPLVCPGRVTASCLCTFCPTAPSPLRLDTHPLRHGARLGLIKTMLRKSIKLQPPSPLSSHTGVLTGILVEGETRRATS